MHQTLLLEDPQPIQKTTWVEANHRIYDICGEKSHSDQVMFPWDTFHCSLVVPEIGDTISKSIFREGNQQGWSLPNFWVFLTHSQIFQIVVAPRVSDFETLVLIASLVPYFRSLQPISHLQVVIHVPFAGSLAHHGRLWQGGEELNQSSRDPWNQFKSWQLCFGRMDHVRQMGWSYNQKCCLNYMRGSDVN